MTRRTGTLTKAIKLWVSPEDYAWLDGEADARGWSVPQVVRWAIARFPYTPTRTPEGEP